MNSTESYTLEQVIRLRPTVQTLLLKWLLQPLAERITLVLANRGTVSPRQVTLMSAGIGTLAAIAFLVSMNWLGMLFFLAAVVLDLVDGKLARLMGTGSAFGIMLDAFNDIYRIIAVALAIIITQNQMITSSLMLIFVGLHFGEFLVNQDINRVAQLWKTTTTPVLNQRETTLLAWSEKLKLYGLKLVLLHYQERLLIVFGLGAMTGDWNLWLIIAITITSLDYYLKYYFDLALVKKHLNPADKGLQNA